MTFAAMPNSPQRRKVADGRLAFRSVAEKDGYDLAHTTATELRMRVPAEKRIEVLQIAYRVLEKMGSKVAKSKAKAITARLKQLGAYPEHKPDYMVLHEGKKA